VLLRLFTDVPNIVAFKDATGDPPAAAALVAQAGDYFDLYSGDDPYTLPLLACGAVGVVGTSTHWTGPLFQQMVTAVQRGDLAAARAVQALGECRLPFLALFCWLACFFFWCFVGCW
jgi:4-hydroxy-tetrahydrodipicolinate synthase